MSYQINGREIAYILDTERKAIKLGSGAFGDVWKANYTVDDKQVTVAVKELLYRLQSSAID